MDESQNTTPAQQELAPPPPPPPSSTSQLPKARKPVKLFLIIFLVLLISLAVSVFLLRDTIIPILGMQKNESSKTAEQKKIPAQQTQTNISIPSEWKTYSSTNCGLSIRYPSDWELSQGTANTHSCYMGVSKKERDTAAGFILTGLRAPEQWEDVKEDMVIKSKFTIAGLEAMEVELKDASVEAKTALTTYIFRNGEVIYTIILISDPAYPENRTILNTIVSSVTVSGSTDNLKKIDRDQPFKQADNTQRRSDVTQILNAIAQYYAENRGQLPPGITTTHLELSSDGVNLCSILVPKYIAALPVDPNISEEDVGKADCTRSYKTGYMVSVDSSSRVTVSAPLAELGQTISVTR